MSHGVEEFVMTFLVFLFVMMGLLILITLREHREAIEMRQERDYYRDLYFNQHNETELSENAKRLLMDD